MLVALPACPEDDKGAPASAAGAPSTGTSEAIREEARLQQREAVDRSTNPKGLPLYAGPLGAVRGVIKVTGDPPPLVPEMIAKLPAEGCPRAHEFERKVYRQGAERTLADVLVTVTEYQGFIEPKGDAARVEIRGCAFDARVIALTFGQRLDVFNLDNQGYMPRLIGTPTYALRVAMPGGPPVPIFVPRAGPFVLVDHTHDYVRADLFVLNYPTFDVTGLDGRFEISGVPVGDVKVTAFVPGFGKVLDKRVKLEAGKTEDLSFEFVFSESEYRASAPAVHQPEPGAAGREAPPGDLEKH